jgi:DNA-binding LacI/PurR family transcriptional regulator
VSDLRRPPERVPLAAKLRRSDLPRPMASDATASGAGGASGARPRRRAGLDCRAAGVRSSGTEVAIPLVIHGSPRVAGVPFVGIDDRAAAEHLLQLGHRSLAVISQPFGPSRRARHRNPAKIGRPSYRVTRERLAGYQAAANPATPQPAALDIYEVAVNSRDEGHRAALALLQATPRPTAVLAMSDELAIGALAAARELDLHVPHDLSVLGWDD